MLRLRPTLILFLMTVFSLLAPAAASAQSCNFAPQPGSAELYKLIKATQSCGGAAQYVDDEIIQAIYRIEGTTAYANPSAFTCQKNASNALGLWQIVDHEYRDLIPKDQQMKDDQGVCSPGCGFSRCYPKDAVEIVSRALLDKIYLWDRENFQALGKLTVLNKLDVFYAAGRYGPVDENGKQFTATPLTNQLVPAVPANAQYPPGHPNYNTITYAEFICAYSGACGSYTDYPPRDDAPHSGQITNPSYNFDDVCLHGQAGNCSSTNPSQKKHPLRPDPYNLVAGEANRKISDPNLTPYCAMRPTAVEINRIDKRQATVNIQVIGTLKSDFLSFIAPLLSIANTAKPDYGLPYEDKAQRYLLDYLEGRAYYEPFAENPDSPEFLNQLEQDGALTPQEINQIQTIGWDNLDPQIQAQLQAKINSGFAFSRLGVFRKLAPKTYQDELKKAVIFRAMSLFHALDENPYGFAPATEQVHDYTVGYWDAAKKTVVDPGKGEAVTLSDFYQNSAWAPLPAEYPDDYQQQYQQWAEKDGGKWAALWPYVPMFTREDSKGFIQISDDPDQKSDLAPQTDVIHPHVARGYEVTTSLSYLLTPFSSHDAATPVIEDKWYPYEPWVEEAPWWIESQVSGGELGKTVCDYKPEAVQLIASSGDTAQDGVVNTTVNKTKVIDNKFYDPAAGEDVTEQCNGVPVTYDQCAKLLPSCDIDESGCFVDQPVRYDPTYFFTYTPFLSQIMTSTILSQRGIFTMFEPYAAADLPEYLTTSWPGVGNPGEDSPKYSYSAANGAKSLAEAGLHKPPNSQGYFYRYLGNIQCAKEKLLSIVQPFISGEQYQPYAYSCFPELTPPQPSPLPAGPGGIAGECPDGGEEITNELATKIPGGIVKLLPNTNGARSETFRLCIKPTMMVIHWSGGYDNENGNDATYTTLVERDLACQYATDTNDVYLMQPFYETEVEMAWCANAWNTYSINNEVAGNNFTAPNPPPNETELQRAVTATCEIMKQYSIPWSQIYGHYQVPNSGKDDPGEAFLLNEFIPRVRNECGNI